MEKKKRKKKVRQIKLSDMKTKHLASSAVKEGNVLFNDALNTFYLRLYGEREKCFI